MWNRVKDKPIPRDRRIYLTIDNFEKGMLNLVQWDPTHKHFVARGGYIAECNAGTHWMEIPKLPEGVFKEINHKGFRFE